MILEQSVIQTPASAMLSQLPPLCVDSMSQVQLNEFIPQLVTIATGRQCPLFGNTQFKPDWWPEDVNWEWSDPGLEDSLSETTIVTADLMRKIVRSCYKHLGQEYLLSAETPSPDNKIMAPVKPPPSKVLFEKQTNSSTPSPDKGKKMDNADDNHCDNPIWVCFLCAKQFSHQNELMVHQDLCEQEEEKRAPPEPVVPKMVVRVYPPKAFCQQRRRRRFKPEPYVPPPKEDFIKQLYLLEKPKEEDCITPKQMETKEIDSDCEIIDEEMLPVTPRTPKSLMSQLSRDVDGSARRRHLSFSQMQESDSESGTEAEHVKLPALSAMLYNIDLSSPLGQRVKKHLKSENFQSVKNPEVFCRSSEKSGFAEKLRQRDIVYPIDFNKKKRKKFSAKYFHRYKFNRSQRQDFMMTLKTGLNKRSRKLLSEVSSVPCKVILTRLKPEVIKEWTRRKPRPVLSQQQRFLQYQQKYMQHQIPYLYNYTNCQNQALRQALTKPILGPMSAKIRHMNESLAKLSKPIQRPQPPMLTQIVKNKDGSETMRMVYNNILSTPSPPRMQRALQLPKGGNRRKQTFDNDRLKKLDDEIIIIDMSSSDEDDENEQKSCKKNPVPSSSVPVVQSSSLSTRPNYQRPGPACSKRPKIKGALLGPLSVRAGSGVLQSSSNKTHYSPPGARTYKEILQKSVAKPGGLVSHNLQFGQPAQGLIKQSNTGLQISNVRSIRPSIHPSSQVSIKNINLSTQFRIQGPSASPIHEHLGEKHVSRRQPVQNPQKMPILQRTLAKLTPTAGKQYSQVKTSVHKMEVNGSNNDKEVVDVICIDDDDD